MPKEARWVHGNAIVADTLHPTLEQVTSETGTALTYTDIVGRRRGWGVTCQGVNQRDTFNWFYAMIPTPTVVDGMPTRLEKVYVLYDTPGTGGNPVLFVRYTFGTARTLSRNLTLATLGTNLTSEDSL